MCYTAQKQDKTETHVNLHSQMLTTKLRFNDVLSLEQFVSLLQNVAQPPKTH